jgi:hypothetical protein
MTQLSSSKRCSSFLLLLGFSIGGCGGSKEGAKMPASDSLPTAIEHEPCDATASGNQRVDTNGDGKPDIVSVMSGGREVCRVVDLNHDDKPDSFLYVDGSGALRRRESDFDRDGRIDEIAYYTGGVIARKDRETNLDGKLDTWDFYEGGKIHHRMRDSDGDGRVDQWWTWPNPDRIECAVIAADHNRDGRPDPNNVIDACSLSGPATAGVSGVDGGSPALAASAPSATGSSATPADGGVASAASGDGGAAPKAGSTASASASAGAAVSSSGAADAGKAASSAASPGAAKASTEPKKETK